MSARPGGGPLGSLRVIEMASVGPVPFAGNLLSQFGADVLRIDRPTDAGNSMTAADPLATGRRGVTVDLREDSGKESLLNLISTADVLIEGMRPGVMERLGLGPQACRDRNPRLIYGRISGYGSRGELAPRAGHDINYLALAGALWPMGEPDLPPKPPLNLVGDYGGGAMFLVCGILAALVERADSGVGQVVETSILEGTVHLMDLFFRIRARDDSGNGEHRRGDPELPEAVLNGTAPWYRVFETSDGKYMAAGAVEDTFYQNLLRTLGIDSATLPSRDDRRLWKQLHERFEYEFRQRSRDEWEQMFSGVDACVTPVLSPSEALTHPHHVAAGSFAGGELPAVAPRFSRTPGTFRTESPSGTPPEGWQV